MKIIIIYAIIYLFAFHASFQNKTWNLQTDDTHITIAIIQDKLAIRSLSDLTNKFNWTSKPSILKLIDSIDIEGKKINTHWKFISETINKKELTLTFENADPAMILQSKWEAKKGPGPIRHTMSIKNNSKKNVTIPGQESIDVQIMNQSQPLTLTYINDDASYPDSVGVYHHTLQPAFNKELKISEVQDWIPLLIIDAQDKKGIYIGWEWSIGRIIINSNANTTNIRMGIGDQFKTDISPGETFEVPPSFIGAYHGDIDACGNSLRKYLFNHSMPSLITKDSGFPKVEWNAFAATGKKQGSWDPVESKYYPFIDDIAPLGFEEVVIDIGWWKSYGDPGHIISDDIDWPKGIPAAAKYANDRGLRFGLYDNESEDLTSDSGKTERFNDIAYLIKNMHAQFYRSDATAGPIANGKFGKNQRAKYSQDVPYWSIKGFYEVIDSLYKTIPGFSWENCSIGGGLKDYAALKRSSKIQNLDVYYPIEARKAFHDASYAMHPMQLASLTGSWSEWQATGSVYEFRSACMGAAYWHPDAPNGNNGGPVWSAKQKQEIKKAVITYKQKLRPLIRKANLYHIFPRPDNKSRDGIQYFDEQTQQGVVYIFQPKDKGPDRIKLKGLKKENTYELTFEDHSNPTQKIKGDILMNHGISVILHGDEKSELMFIKKMK